MKYYIYCAKSFGKSEWMPEKFEFAKNDEKDAIELIEDMACSTEFKLGNFGERQYFVQNYGGDWDEPTELCYSLYSEEQMAKKDEKEIYNVIRSKRSHKKKGEKMKYQNIEELSVVALLQYATDLEKELKALETEYADLEKTYTEVKEKISEEESVPKTGVNMTKKEFQKIVTILNKAADLKINFAESGLIGDEGGDQEKEMSEPKMPDITEFGFGTLGDTITPINQAEEVVEVEAEEVEKEGVDDLVGDLQAILDAEPEPAKVPEEVTAETKPTEEATDPEPKVDNTPAFDLGDLSISSTL